MNRGLFLHHDAGTDGRDWSAMLDLYVDGLLSAQDAAAFEARLLEDHALRAELDAQRAVDASIKDRWGVPEGVQRAADMAVRNAGAAGATPAKGILSRIGWVRIAAVVGIAAMGGYVYYLRSAAKTAYPTESPIAAYQSIVKGGFRPYEVCTDDDEFAHYTKKYLGRAMVVDAFPGLALVGWDNRHNVMSIETDSLLATVDGTQVVVFMDRGENDRSMPRGGEGLHVFKRMCAGISLVEVSPLSGPKLLPGFRSREVDSEPPERK